MHNPSSVIEEHKECHDTNQHFRPPDRFSKQELFELEIQFLATRLLSSANTGRFKMFVGVSVAYNSQTGNSKMKLQMEYERVIQELFITFRLSSPECYATSESHLYIP
jgi:hypothetical protein